MYNICVVENAVYIIVYTILLIGVAVTFQNHFETFLPAFVFVERILYFPGLEKSSLIVFMMFTHINVSYHRIAIL